MSYFFSCAGAVPAQANTRTLSVRAGKRDNIRTSLFFVEHLQEGFFDGLIVVRCIRGAIAHPFAAPIEQVSERQRLPFESLAPYLGGLIEDQIAKAGLVFVQDGIGAIDTF